MSLNLNTNNWKEFQLNEIFLLKWWYYNKKPEHSDFGNIPFLASTETNNWVTEFYTLDDIMSRDKVWNSDNTLDKKIYDWNCIAVTVNGSVCNAFYQSRPFTCSHDITALYLKNYILNEGIAWFLCTVIMLDKYRWSYGRKPHDVKKFWKSIIKLPVDSSWNLDREFMENYVKSLHYKTITTKNSSWLDKLETNKWKEFNLFPKYFDVLPWKYYYSDEYEDWETPYISASNENNWIQQFINLNPDFPWNCIITWKVWCTAFYQKYPFCATSDVNVFIPKFEMTQNIWIFITTVINFNENYKWSYWRQCRVWNSKKIKVKLPVDNLWNPDREFMENYIKKLPYWDRI